MLATSDIAHGNFGKFLDHREQRDYSKSSPDALAEGYLEWAAVQDETLQRIWCRKRAVIDNMISQTPSRLRIERLLYHTHEMKGVLGNHMVEDLRSSLSLFSHFGFDQSGIVKEVLGPDEPVVDAARRYRPYRRARRGMCSARPAIGSWYYTGSWSVFQDDDNTIFD